MLHGGRKEKEKKNKKGIDKPEVYGANGSMVLMIIWLHKNSK
jgi:hypothetical protein